MLWRARDEREREAAVQHVPDEVAQLGRVRRERVVKVHGDAANNGEELDKTDGKVIEVGVDGVKVDARRVGLEVDAARGQQHCRQVRQEKAAAVALAALHNAHSKPDREVNIGARRKLR